MKNHSVRLASLGLLCITGIAIGMQQSKQVYIFNQSGEDIVVKVSGKQFSIPANVPTTGYSVGMLNTIYDIEIKGGGDYVSNRNYLDLVKREASSKSGEVVHLYIRKENGNMVIAAHYFAPPKSGMPAQSNDSQIDNEAWAYFSAAKQEKDRYKALNGDGWSKAVIKLKQRAVTPNLQMVLVKIAKLVLGFKADQAITSQDIEMRYNKLRNIVPTIDMESAQIGKSREEIISEILDQAHDILVDVMKQGSTVKDFQTLPLLLQKVVQGTFLDKEYASKVKQICNADYATAVLSGATDLCKYLKQKFQGDLLKAVPTAKTIEEAAQRIIDGIYAQLIMYRMPQGPNRVIYVQ